MFEKEAQRLMGGTYAIRGGRGGLALSIARRILNRGGDVMLVGTEPPAAIELEVTALVAQTGAETRRIRYSYLCEVDDDSLRAAFEDVHLRGAVTIAGTVYGHRALHTTSAALRQSFQASTIDCFAFAQAAARRLCDIGAGGAILAVSPWPSDRSGVGGAAYAASVAGLTALLGCLADDVAAQHIRVSSLEIGRGASDLESIVPWLVGAPTLPHN